MPLLRTNSVPIGTPIIAPLRLFAVIINQYQEQPTLLDPHLEDIVTRLISQCKAGDNSRTYHLLYTLTKACIAARCTPRTLLSSFDTTLSAACLSQAAHGVACIVSMHVRSIVPMVPLPCGGAAVRYATQFKRLAPGVPCRSAGTRPWSGSSATMCTSCAASSRRSKHPSWRRERYVPTLLQQLVELYPR
jgi:hypothetical protein